MKPAIILQEFEKLAEELGITIKQEKGNFKGGYCLVKQEKIIIINRLKPLEHRIWDIAHAFSMFDIAEVHMKPYIRDLICLKNKS